MLHEPGRQVDAIAALLTVTVHYPCAAGDIPEMIRCWSRFVRELRADLETVRGHPDEEVLMCNLRDAKAHLVGLLAILRKKVRAA
jgi:hypothetical protein